MRVYEGVAQTLVDHGVDVIFGLMGDGNLKLIPHLTSQLGVRFVSSRHESAGVAMADGYARVTGRVGVCSVTQGPGLTNALTPLVSARKARTPLVLLAGDTPLGVPGLPQDADQEALYAGAGIPVQRFTAETGAADVAAAITAALALPGPIGVSMPTDLQDQELDAALSTGAPATASPGMAAMAGSTFGGAPPGGQLAGGRGPAARGAAAGDPRRPGAIQSGAREALIALADQTGALLTTSLPAKAWFAGHPWNIGVTGGFATPLAAELVRDADLVVAFGASVNPFTSKAGTLFRAPTKLVHVDVAPTAIGAYTPAHLGVMGDARATAQGILELLADEPAREGYRTAAVRDRQDTFDFADAHVDASREGAASDPRTACARLERLLPPTASS